MNNNFPTIIDTHCHLNYPSHQSDWEKVARAALAEGIWMVIIGYDYESSLKAVEMAEKFPFGVYASVGTHPLRLSSFVDVEAFRKLAGHPKVVAVGEVGLDFHDLKLAHQTDIEHRETIVSLQYDALKIFFDLSQEFKLPLVLHVRDSYEEMLKYIQHFDDKTTGFDCRGIVHHFSGDWRTAAQYLNFDFLLSITDVLARSRIRDEVIKKIPITKLTVESECPHLLGESSGAGRAMPNMLPSTLAYIAAMKNLKIAEVAGITTKNSLRIFSKILRPVPTMEV